MEGTALQVGQVRIIIITKSRNTASPSDDKHTEIHWPDFTESGITASASLQMLEGDNILQVIADDIGKKQDVPLLDEGQ